jgi:glycosyltransferase involved in cell wall biosynthesis
MSVAEALASGTPVVVTRTCPWPEIEEWNCGFWVEQSSDAIARGLHDVTANPQQAVAQGRAGRRLIRARMAPEHIGACWRDIYRKAAALAPAAA